MIDDATRRLDAALGGLLHSAEALRGSRQTIGRLQAEVASLTGERQKLAQELAVAQERLRRLERVNRDVSQKLDRAMGQVRAALEA